MIVFSGALWERVVCAHSVNVEAISWFFSFYNLPTLGQATFQALHGHVIVAWSLFVNVLGHTQIAHFRVFVYQNLCLNLPSSQVNI